MDKAEIDQYKELMKEVREVKKEIGVTDENTALLIIIYDLLLDMRK